MLPSSLPTEFFDEQRDFLTVQACAVDSLRKYQKRRRADC
jgi:hypothetical protein